jgi:hypothetical protein
LLPDLAGDIGVALIARGFQPARGQAERYKHLKLYHEVTLAAPDKSYSVDLHWQLAPPYARAFGLMCARCG